MPQLRNNFDFLRFVAAAMVVWGHSYGLLKLPGSPALWGISIHSFGVVIFFSISGYLVTGSLMRSATLVDFFWKRCLRIFPALIVCTIFSAMVLGPIFTTAPLVVYFKSSLFFDYFKNAALNVHYTLPAVFADNPLRAVNGSLWSLPAEFLCYITVAICVSIALAMAPKRLLPLLMTAITASIISITLYMQYVYQGERIIIYNMNILHALRPAPYFFVGSILYLMKDSWTPRLDVAALLTAILFFATMCGGAVLMIAHWLLIPYAVLAIGLRQTPTIGDWHDRFGDVSYGMYLYAFPIQQMIVASTGGHMPVGILIAASLPASLACGWLSWVFIEKRAISMKGAATKIIDFAHARMTRIAGISQP